MASSPARLCAPPSPRLHVDGAAATLPDTSIRACQALRQRITRRRPWREENWPPLAPWAALSLPPDGVAAA